MSLNILAFFAGFVGMEWAAWAAHKYLMHGPLWFLHRDHHTPGKGFFQANDSFFLIFALPSFLSILFGSLYSMRPLMCFGFGIMAFGFVYVMVHEILIHRRVVWFRLPKSGYWFTIVRRHQLHHHLRERQGGRYFGMLWAPPGEWSK